MQDTAQYSLEDDGAGTSRLVLSGPLTLAAIGPFERALKNITAPLSAIDLAGVEEIDTVGAWVVCQMAHAHECEITGASPSAHRLLDAVQAISAGDDIHPPIVPGWERVPLALGKQIYAARSGIYGVVGFFGQILIGAASLLRHPFRFPVKSLVHQMELVGVSALPIIGLMSFLIGIVIAQQGSVQLEQFGAEALTINLVGRITLRELGVLMTAIMVAGRSGSAFAARSRRRSVCGATAVAASSTA
jgi:phospholipid/cholesterol/gamma-HCH transport system permease protein